VLKGQPLQVSPVSAAEISALLRASVVKLHFGAMVKVVDAGGSIVTGEVLCVCRCGDGPELQLFHEATAERFAYVTSHCLSGFRPIRRVDEIYCTRTERRSAMELPTGPRTIG
jgi:hypothetical protein